MSFGLSDDRAGWQLDLIGSRTLAIFNYPTSVWTVSLPWLPCSFATIIAWLSSLGKHHYAIPDGLWIWLREVRATDLSLQWKNQLSQSWTMADSARARGELPVSVDSRSEIDDDLFVPFYGGGLVSS